jgi:hypothetical protein
MHVMIVVVVTVYFYSAFFIFETNKSRFIRLPSCPYAHLYIHLHQILSGKTNLYETG